MERKNGNLNDMIKNVFHFLSIISHGLVLSNYLSEYIYSLARIATYETEPLFLCMPIKSETYSFYPYKNVSFLDYHAAPNYQALCPLSS